MCIASDIPATRTRFGKIEAHEAINAVARETLLVAKEIAETDGFELIHALVDSLYVWKEGAAREDYDRLSQEVENRTRLPLAIESIYRYVVFLPSKQYADVPVPNRFFAVGEDGDRWSEDEEQDDDGEGKKLVEKGS